MSIVSDARRAAVQVCFGGVDVTRDIRPYLLSLTWTDNEEDEADDLQIKLQDRDGIWLTKWLTSTVQAATEVGTAQEEAADGENAASTTYRVTPAIGLNVRSGPGTQ